MAYYVINGGKRLEGSVTISGAKNAALAIIPACILAGESCRLENLPRIEDVHVLEQILRMMGAGVEFTPDGGMRIDPKTISTRHVTFDMVTRMRASYYLLGAMLGRYGYAEVALPGGCQIGQRPIDQHIKGFRALGADVSIQRGIITAKADKLVGAEIYLDVVSVGATINIMLAAVCAEGKTIISNAAKEPHVVDTANFLNMMGAQVKGAGTDVIRITGGRRLHGCTYPIIPDQIEAGTYMIAAAATGGSVKITNVIPRHLESITAKLCEMGVEVLEGDDYVVVTRTGGLTRVNVKTQPYPGFPTDMQPQMAVLMCLAEGISNLNESVYDNRFRYTEELLRMGARIKVDGKTAIIEGRTALRPARVRAVDLRAGAAMVIAGLATAGESEIDNIHLIERGYDDLVGKLRRCGAVIEKITEHNG